MATRLASLSQTDTTRKDIGDVKEPITADTDMRNRILVVHAGRRDSYEVAKAFEDYDTVLVTDFYYAGKTLSDRISKFIFGSKVYRRHRDDLDIEIRSSFPLFILDILGGIFPNRNLIYKLRTFFLARAARLELRRNKFSHVVVYHESGADRIFPACTQGIRKILFQMHPHPQMTARIYRDYLRTRPSLHDELAAEERETSQGEHVENLSGDAFLSDAIIATTTFSARTLISAGADEKTIKIASYGSDFSNNLTASAEKPSMETAVDATTKLTLAFVGQFIIRKGVYELIDVIRRRPDIELNIFTRDDRVCQKRIERWFGTVSDNVSIFTILENDAMWHAARSCDFLILPSLVEGFGLVITEAMANGLPVIASRNTALPDLLRDRPAGLVLGGYMNADIEQGLDDAILRRDDWPNMRRAALDRAKDNTWQDFRANVRKAVFGVDSNK